MHVLPLRLNPGADLRSTLAAALAETGAQAGFVLQAIGSLSVARLRLAGRDELTELSGDYEILTLAGSLSVDGPHLHMSIADRDGNVLGGHVGPGCVVRTTVEALVAVLPEHSFTRVHDAATGYPELHIARAAGSV